MHEIAPFAPEPVEVALQPVEHPVQQRRTQPRRQGLAHAGDRFAEAQAAGGLVDLNRRPARFQPDDFAGEPGMPHLNPLVQLEPRQVDGDRRAGDGKDASAHRFSFT